MAQFTVRVNGQRLVLAYARFPDSGNAVSLFSNAALSTPITLPYLMTSDSTVYWAETGEWLTPVYATFSTWVTTTVQLVKNAAWAASDPVVRSHPDWFARQLSVQVEQGDGTVLFTGRVASGDAVEPAPTLLQLAADTGGSATIDGGSA